MGLFKRWSINLIFAFAALVYILGLFVEILDIDSAQYAAISKEMVETGSYLEVFQQGQDYLDKPPFLFWLNSFFFWIFGYFNWSFKIGSVLFSAVGVIATYKLGNLLYNKRIGFVAALMLMTSFSMVLMNNDVRTDTILTSAVVISVWKLTAYLYYKKRSDLIYGFVAMAIAMMTKGPIGMLIPLFALVSYTLGRKRYNDLFRAQWLWGIAIVAILLIPMSYGLYQQFDAHPEKVVNIVTPDGVVKEDSVSGLKFFYWDQSFGRITGDNPWQNDAGPLFFVHTFIWSFFPWSLLAFWAIFWRIITAIKDVVRGEKKQEWLTLGGFLLTFFSLSLSNYKLPHYIYVVMPFAAIFTSEFTLRIAFEKPKSWYRIALSLQILNVILAAAIVIFIGTYVFPDGSWSLWVISGVAMAISSYVFMRGSNLNRLVVSSMFGALAMYVFINGLYFPRITEYQPSDDVVREIRALNIDEDHLYVHPPRGMFSLAYRTGFELNRINRTMLDTTIFYPNTYAYIDEKGMELIDDSRVSVEVVKSYPYYPVTMPTWEFMNHETRKDAVEMTYLVRILIPD
ncbi:MAG: glycosyltransferase family 39 protein [Flavobacteriia bacterium]|nr:glycosyltransferase family 39 protein [Flavobacteriia bacterium]